MYVYTHKHITPFLPTVFSLTLSCGDILSPHIAKFLCQTLVYLPFLSELSLPIAHHDLPGNATERCPELGQMLPPYLIIIFFLSFWSQMPFPCFPCWLQEDPDLVSSHRAYHGSFSPFYCSPPTLRCRGCSDVFFYLTHFLWCLCCFPVTILMCSAAAAPFHHTSKHSVFTFKSFQSFPPLSLLCLYLVHRPLLFSPLVSHVYLSFCHRPHFLLQCPHFLANLVVTCLSAPFSALFCFWRL